MVEISPLAIAIGLTAYFVTVLITGSLWGPVALVIDLICGISGLQGLGSCQ